MKLKLTLKRILNKKGMSLAEVLVALVITTILITLTVSLVMPVTKLMNNISTNVDMDTMCDTANEYIRGSLQNANKVAVFSESDGGIQAKFDEFKNSENVQKKYEQVKAIAVLKNGDGDYRIYDFGNITDKSGLPSASEDYYAFDDVFYDGTSYFVTFSAAGTANAAETSSSDGETAPPSSDPPSPDPPVTSDTAAPAPTTYSAGYLTVQSQCYRTHDGDGNAVDPKAVNQLRSLSFRLFNGSAELNGASVSVNMTEDIGGVPVIKSDGNGVVILYTAFDYDTFTGNVTT